MPCSGLFSYCSFQPVTGVSGVNARYPLPFFRYSSTRSSSFQFPASFSATTARVTTVPATVLFGVFGTMSAISICFVPFLARSPYSNTCASLPNRAAAASLYSSGTAASVGFFSAGSAGLGASELQPASVAPNTRVIRRERSIYNPFHHKTHRYLVRNRRRQFPGAANVPVKISLKTGRRQRNLHDPARLSVLSRRAHHLHHLRHVRPRPIERVIP